MKDQNTKTDQVVQEAAAIADRLQTALWIFDIERIAMVWANAAGLSLWGADNLAALRSRDFLRRSQARY